MLRTALTIVVLGLPIVAPSCSSSSEDNVSWFFISNPSGGGTSSGGGAVIVIHSGSTRSAAVEPDGRWLHLEGEDTQGAVAVHLLTGGDAAWLEREGEGELRCRALEAPSIRLPGARGTRVDGLLALRIDGADGSRLDPRSQGPVTAWLAARGNLLVLESASGLVVFDGVAPALRLPGHKLLTQDQRIVALAPDLVYHTLTPAPPAPPEERITPVQGRDSLRIFGPRRQLVAELPRSMVTLHGGASGLFLSAMLPGGDGHDRAPLALWMAADNRYLVREQKP